MISRFATGLVGLGLGLVVVADPASADPPAPTDYRSEVDALDPSVDGLTARIIGGDSFLELTVADGLDVVVVGYQGEPYLRFAPDGTVYENQLSPSKPLNDDRFGEGDLTGTDAEAEPEWQELASGGVHQWHDHRTHWMQPERPFGKEPGDRILEGVVPIEVDGRAVDIQVSSTWLPGPSPVAAIVGAILGVLVIVAVLGSQRPVTVWAPVLAAVAASALVVGVWQFTSVPASTGPPRSTWLLPALALAFAFVATVLRQRAATATAAVAGVELLMWCWLRRAVLTRALLPTDAPWSFDRSATVVVAVVSLAAVGDLLWRSGLIPRPGAPNLVTTG